MIIDPIIYRGRPSDTRIDKEERCYALLDKLGIDYTRVDHENAYTIEQCHSVEAILKAEICKNLLLTNRQMTDVYLLLIPGKKPFKTKLLSKQIGSSRLSFASAEQMLSLMDITPGSLSVMGLMNDKQKKIRLLIDSDLLSNELFACHPCINTSTLCFSTTALIDTLLPELGYNASYVSLPWDGDELP